MSNSEINYEKSLEDRSGDGAAMVVVVMEIIGRVCCGGWGRMIKDKEMKKVKKIKLKAKVEK